MTTPFLDSHGNPIAQDHVLGSGSSALVLLQNEVAVKIPLKCLWSDAYEIEANIQKLHLEQNVYRRLQESLYDQRSNGVVRCLEMTSQSTQLVYMSNGDLETYLKRFRPPLELQLSWCFEIIQSLSFIHDRGILVADIASRNFVLDSDLSIKFCDFSEASIFSLGTDMNLVDDHGYNVQIDIGLLGTVMYEIVTGEKLQIDLFKEAENTSEDGRAIWPKRKFLPTTNDIWLGWIIEGCWDGKFQNAHSILQALHSTCLRSPQTGPGLSTSSISTQTLVKTFKENSVLVIFGLISVTLLAGKKALLRT